MYRRIGLTRLTEGNRVREVITGDDYPSPSPCGNVGILTVIGTLQGTPIIMLEPRGL